MKRTYVPGLRLVSSSEQRRSFFANDLDVFNAEIWAREALLRVTGSMVLGNVTYRNYSDQVGKFGDVVNVARPGTMRARRKGALCEEVRVQDLTADSFSVPLDQYLYSAFKICDGEENRGMLDLIETYLNPAADALATKIDLIIGGQHVHFWDNFAGHLLGLNATNIDDAFIDLMEVMDTNGVPPTGRQVILTQKAKSAALKEKLFVSAEQAGQNRTLRTGELGPLYGLDFFAANTQPYITPGQTAVTGAATAAFTAGTTAITADAVTGAGFTAGGYIRIVGDDTPLRIAAVGALAAGAQTITLAAPGLKRDTADNAVITQVTAGAVNKAGGYAGTTVNPRTVGYAKHVLTDGWVTPPKQGQPVSFGLATEIYTIIEVANTDDDGVALAANNYNILLDRPLEANIADNATVNLGPAGGYNYAFNADSLAAAFRPLPKPRTGALSSVITYKGIPMRVSITYDGKGQYHLVVLDLLMGISPFDTTQAAVLFG
jgi:hypothetical protein